MLGLLNYLYMNCVYKGTDGEMLTFELTVLKSAPLQANAPKSSQPTPTPQHHTVEFGLICKDGFC